MSPQGGRGPARGGGRGVTATNRRTARRRRQSAVALTIFAVFGIIVLAVVALVPDDPSQDAVETRDFSTTITFDESTTSSTPTTALDPSRLTPEGQELLALVDAGRGTRFHARYSLGGDLLPEGTSSASLEIWRSGSSVRQDSEVVNAQGRVRNRDIGTPTGTISCQEAPDQPLTCQQVSGEPFDVANDFLSQALELLGDATVTARDEAIAGYPARCFVMESGDERQEICLTGAGVPLVVDTGGLRAEVESIDESFDDSVFEPPVPPVVVSTSISG